MKAIYWITPGLALVAGLFLGRGCSTPQLEIVEKHQSDTVTVTRIDTVVVERPVPVRVVETRTDTLLLYRPQDTIRVPVPIRRYSFRDSLYALDVSGYNVTLDHMEVYPRTIYQTVTNTMEMTIREKKRWALTIGPGIGYGPRGVQPYVGVTFGFVIWSK